MVEPLSPGCHPASHPSNACAFEHPQKLVEYDLVTLLQYHVNHFEKKKAYTSKLNGAFGDF